MDCAEDYVKYCINHVLENNFEELNFFNNRIDKTCLDRLNLIVEKPFTRLSYTDAINVLMDHESYGHFTKENEEDETVYWGIDLRSEHERYLCEAVYNNPVILYNYPSDIKAFYMRKNDDNRTVAAMDVLVPNIGELIGGSQREERYEVLKDKLIENNLNEEDYNWYLDLRKYGSVPHSGFGLGFERLIMLVTGLKNIRDVIPFPRAPCQIN